MPDVLNFKLDPLSLLKLDPKGENFLDWRVVWSRGFRFAGLGEYITGVKDRLVGAAELVEWEKLDDQAFVMLLSSIYTSLMTYIILCMSSIAAWKVLADRFDRDTGNSTIYLFCQLTNLQYKDSTNLQSYLDAFRNL